MPLVSARYPLDRALDAFDHAQRTGTLKVLLDVASPPAPGSAP
jgi:hypothetical protein